MIGAWSLGASPFIGNVWFENDSLWAFKGRKQNVSRLNFFGCKCFCSQQWKKNLGKFDYKANEAIFVGYSLTSKSYRFFNQITLNIKESVHIFFDENMNLEKNHFE